MKPVIRYNSTYECEDRQTVDAVLNLCKNAEIETAGAFRSPVINIEEYGDGDQGVVIKIEAPPQNGPWSKSVYDLIGKLWKKFPGANLYPETEIVDNCHIFQYRMNICTHACNPD